MNKIIVVLGLLAAGLTACKGGSGTGSTAQADTVVLDTRCSADADCPSGFACEEETEHGVTTSYCVSDDSAGTSTGTCPAGYEQETEHAETFCKPHGSDDTIGGGTGQAGDPCTTSADCATGLECETQIEGGATTQVCKVHGGG